MISSLLVGALALQASAFPFVLDALDNENVKRQLPGLGTPAAKKLSKARTNCGPVPCLTFSEDQLVSTTGEHAWASPAKSQIRGPCPGLNAAANHGYLDRSGVSTIPDTVIGLQAAYGMSPDLGGFLAAFAVLIDGDPILGTWSIGGPPPSDALTSGLLGQAQGISFSHNKYEGDASIGRFDAFLNHGDAHSLDVSRFASAFAANTNNRYNLDLFSQNFGMKAAESIATNPFSFFAPFSGLVAPAAYNFVINFMSNHTAELPSGYLDGNMFKEFFAVTGKPGSFKWLPGQERIPENWYKRTATNEYNIPDVFGDLGIQFLAYPQDFKLGGNTNGVNTFTGVDLTNFTGGVFNAENLLQGNNLACFFAQFAQAGIPDLASLPLNKANAVTNILNKFISPVVTGLKCPAVAKFDKTLFDKYPGHTYNPTGKATNF